MGIVEEETSTQHNQGPSLHVSQSLPRQSMERERE